MDGPRDDQTKWSQSDKDKYHMTSLIHGIPVAQTVKNLPEMLEIQAQSLGWEDPLEKGMATHSDILA